MILLSQTVKILGRSTKSASKPEFTHSAQYIAKKKADKNSYVWDRLIEAFTTHMLAGTTIVPAGHTFELADHEKGVRHMAVVPRYMRRVFGDAILEAIEKGAGAQRFTRAYLPGPTERDQDTGFLCSAALALPRAGP